MDSKDRAVDHRKPEQLESLLRFFAERLGPIEAKELDGALLSENPVLFIMGCARSGSTLVLQYLAYLGMFAYPTNFLSRFYYAPYLGAKLQQMLFDADFGQELTAWACGATFESVLGKTRGPTSPHGFQYFWRRFFPLADVAEMDLARLSAANGAEFVRELRAVQGVRDMPMVLKGMMLNWHIPYLAQLDKGFHFLYIKRDLADNTGSLVRAREEFCGHVGGWYSFKPPGYEGILELDPVHQAAWQVLETNAAVEEGLATVPEERVLNVTYEQFCRQPRQLLEQIFVSMGHPTGSRGGSTTHLI